MRTVLEPLAAASWPLSIIAVALIFKEQLNALIRCVRQLNAFGHTADFANPEPGQQQAALPAPPGTVPAIAVTENLPPPDPVFDRFDKDLMAVIEEKIHGDDRTKLAWAIRERSISEAARLHEVFYRVIFGTQIATLKGLNVMGPQPIKELEEYYEGTIRPAYEQYHKDRPFVQWGGFLFNAGYVAYVEGSNQSTIEITEFGRQFLRWLVQVGLSEGKPG